MSVTTASGVSAQRSVGDLAVKRETCLSKTKVLLDIPDDATKEVYKRLVVEMGGELTRSSTAHVAVATSFAKPAVRVSARRLRGTCGRAQTGIMARSADPGSGPPQVAKLQGTPVVTPDWLKDCHSKGFQASCRARLCGTG